MFLPLNLVAGTFGMNVGGAPFIGVEAGYWIVAAILIVLGLAGGWLFRRIGWL